MSDNRYAELIRLCIPYNQVASLDLVPDCMPSPPVLKNDDDSDSENAKVDFLAAKQSVKSPCF